MPPGPMPIGTAPIGIPQQSHGYTRADFCESLNKIDRCEQPDSPRQAALMTKIQDYTKYHLQQKKAIAPGIIGTNFSNVLYVEGNDGLDPVGAEWRHTNLEAETRQIIRLNAGINNGTLQSMECDTLELDRILMGENGEPPQPYTDTVRAALPFAGHDGHGNATVLFHALNPATAAVLPALLRTDKENEKPENRDQLGYARAAWLAILIQKTDAELEALKVTLVDQHACTREQAEALVEFAKQLKDPNAANFSFPAHIEVFLGPMTDKLLEVQDSKLIKNVALGREKVTRPSGDADRAHVFSLMTATNSVGVMLENEYMNEQGAAQGRHISISHPRVINDCLGMKAEDPHAQAAYIEGCCRQRPIIVRDGTGFEVMFVDWKKVDEDSVDTDVSRGPRERETDLHLQGPDNDPDPAPSAGAGGGDSGAVAVASGRAAVAAAGIAPAMNAPVNGNTAPVNGNAAAPIPGLADDLSPSGSADGSAVSPAPGISGPTDAGAATSAAVESADGTPVRSLTQLQAVRGFVGNFQPNL